MTENNELNNSVNSQQPDELIEATSITAETEVTEQMESIPVNAQEAAYNTFAETAEMPKVEEVISAEETTAFATDEPVSPGFENVDTSEPEPLTHTPWYRKVGTNMVATLGACACGLLVVGLVAGFSAYAGATMMSGVGHDRVKTEQLATPDRGDRNPYDAYGYDDDYSYGPGYGHKHGYMDEDYDDSYGGYGYDDGYTYGYGYGHGHGNHHGYMDGTDGTDGMGKGDRVMPDGSDDMPQRDDQGSRGQRGTDDGSSPRREAPNNSTQTIA